MPAYSNRGYIPMSFTSWNFIADVGSWGCHIPEELWAENQELQMILVLFAARETSLISHILRFILSTKWTLSSEYLILQRQRKRACCNIFLQANKGRLSLKHLMNLATRPNAAEPDHSNPLSPLIFSSTGCCRSNIIPALTILKYWLFIVKLFAVKTVQTEKKIDQPYWKYLRFGSHRNSFCLWLWMK